MAATAARSSFITGLAWTFIACGMLGVLASAAPLAIVATVVPADELRARVREIGTVLPLPGFIDAAFAHLEALLAALLALSIATLATAIGLLARREWARVAFIALSVVAALWHLAGALAPLPWIFGPLPWVQAFAPELRPVAETLLRMGLWATIGSGLLFGGAFAWLAKRLAGKDVRAEFSGRDA